MSIVAKSSAWKSQVRVHTSGRDVPRVFSPPYGGSAYFGQAYRWEEVLHYKFWVFVAVRAWMLEFAGGGRPRLGTIKSKPEMTHKRVKNFSAHANRKALGAPEEHEEFTPYPRDDQLVRLLSKPNKRDVGFDLWATHILFKKLTGQAHWWVMRNGWGVPVEIWVIPTHWMRLETDREGQPVAYAVSSPWGTLQHVPYKDVISFYDHSPLNRYEGAAVLQAISEWIDCYESQIRTRLAVYKNGAMPAFHIALGESYADPDEAMLGRYYAKWFQRFQGEDNAGRPVITGSDVEIKDIPGHDPASIVAATIQSEDQMRDMVLAAYGVPKGVIGLEPTNDTSAYAPLNQFVRFQMNHELGYTGEVLTEEYVKRTPGKEDGVCFWEDRIVMDHAAKIQEIESRRAGGAISPDEERAMWGAAPWPHGGENPLINGVEMPWFTGKVESEKPLESAVQDAKAALDVEDKDERTGLLKLFNRAHGIVYGRLPSEHSIEQVKDSPLQQVLRAFDVMLNRGTRVDREQLQQIVDEAKRLVKEQESTSIDEHDTTTPRVASVKRKSVSRSHAYDAMRSMARQFFGMDEHAQGFPLPKGPSGLDRENLTFMCYDQHLSEQVHEGAIEDYLKEHGAEKVAVVHGKYETRVSAVFEMYDEKSLGGASGSGGGYLVPVKRLKSYLDEDRPFIVAVDLHHTLMDGGHGEWNKPNDGAVEGMKELQGMGCRLIVWTVLDDDDAVKLWLEDNDIPYDAVNQNPFVSFPQSHKIYADAYIDDKGVTFTDWAGATEKVKERMRNVAKWFAGGVKKKRRLSITVSKGTEHDERVARYKKMFEVCEV